MARYRGPRLRVIRRVGTALPGLTRKEPKRQTPPGQHGATRKKLSDYGHQLLEKQKVRYHYGVSERQLVRLFRAAAAQRRATGDALFALLERRLDNVVFRLRFAPTMPAARQVVSHGHILVNGRRVNIPSYRVRTGDVISVAPSSQLIPLIRDGVVSRDPRTLPSFLEVAPDDPYKGRVVGEPKREDVPFQVDDGAVISYYTRRV